ncbi:MAG: phasin family protein [Rhodospirillaceae bacterium]|nr:phasin family protein [Rhodospirillaceae bacterium]
MEKVYADFVAFNQDNFDAFVKSSTTFAKGVEQFTKHIAELAQKSVEDAVELSKKFATVKNVNDVVALQTKLIEEGFESAIEESKKVADLSASVIKEASAPLAERVKANIVAINAAAANVQSTVAKATTGSKKAA